MKTYSGYLILMLIMLLAGCARQDEHRDISQVSREQINKYMFTYLIENDTSVFYGELIYVPVYSGIHYGDEGKTIELAITLSIHNTDLGHPIRLEKVNYHNKKGDIIRNLLTEPVILMPLETRNFFIGEKDKTGGAGANFIVDWNTENTVSSPVIEAIMITTQMNQGISFTTNGRIIKKYGITNPY